MDILFLLVLGFVQGLTEFLPISSSGHLVLLSNLFGITDSLFLSVILHMATLLSIVVVLHKEVLSIIKKPFSNQSMCIAVATIPTGLIALVLMPLIERSFSGFLLPICFFASALLLLYSQHRAKNKVTHPLSFKDAVAIGIFQGFATFPGVSRSGATISGALICGVDRNQAGSFSFLISIPIILLSMCLEIYKIVVRGEVFSVNILGLVLAFLTAFLVGVISIKWMLKLTQKANLKGFSIYLIFIAILSIFV